MYIKLAVFKILSFVNIVISATVPVRNPRTRQLDLKEYFSREPLRVFSSPFGGTNNKCWETGNQEGRKLEN